MRTTRVLKSTTAPLPQRLKPRKSPAQSRSRALVEAIVEAGSRVLERRGWAGLTMQQVASLAGVSPGSLYQYFPDKGSLVVEIIERQSTRELEFQMKRFRESPPGASLAASIDAMVSATLAFQRAEGALMRQTLRAMPFLGRYERLSERAQTATSGLRALLEQHRSEIKRADLDLATHVIANAIHSLTHDGVLKRPETLEDDVLAAEISHLALRYLT